MEPTQQNEPYSRFLVFSRLNYFRIASIFSPSSFGGHICLKNKAYDDHNLNFLKSVWILSDRNARNLHKQMIGFGIGSPV